MITEHELLLLNNEVKRLRDRLQFDPGGSDKIDELEQALEFSQHKIECLERHLKEFTEQLRITLFNKDCSTTCNAPDDCVSNGCALENLLLKEWRKE